MHALALQLVYAGGEIVHSQHHAVVSARLLVVAVGQLARARRAGAAQDELQVPDGDLRERGQVLGIELEAELTGVEIDRAADVANLVANAPGTRNMGGGHGSSSSR